ncbi:2126_t:CDS:2, partial [Cetraspora pellucida]
SPEQTLLLGMDWFRQTGARLHADERKLYMQRQGKFVEIPMFYEGEIPPAPLAVKMEYEELKEPDDSDPFDDFEFDDEDLDEAEGFLTDQCSELELYDNPWLDHESPAVYLSGVEGVPVEETEREEESVIDKLKKNLDDEALTNDQKNHVSDVLSKEVDVFAETVDDLGQTSAYVHEINTGSHIVGREGIHPDEGKVEKVRNFPIPQSLHELRGFLGLASYYRKFIPNFAAVARPLHLLLRKCVKFEWRKDQDDAFNKLKQYLINAPILRYPNFDKTFVIHADASGFGLGAVLAQKDDQ